MAARYEPRVRSLILTGWVVRRTVVALAAVACAAWGAWLLWASGLVWGELYTTPAPPHRVAARAIDSVPEVSAEVGSARPGSLAGVEVAWHEVGRGVLPVTGDAHPLTGEVWIGEQGGAVRILSDGGLGEPVLDLSDRTDADGERGLLGLAFDVDGERLYVHISNPNGHTELLEFSVLAIERGEPGPGRLVLTVGQPRGNHNGGAVVFGPDKFLYLALGDGGGSGDRQGNAQDLTNLLGSIIRIDPTGGQPYAVPMGNPYADPASAAALETTSSDSTTFRPEIWAYGMRNPFRISFDDDGSLWVADVGQDRFEEVTRIPPGLSDANLGWNLFEGDAAFGGSVSQRHELLWDRLSNYVAPALTYDHGADRCSIIGGRVYRGDAIPDLRGSYLYGDFCEQELRAFEIDDPSTDRSLGLNLPGGPTAFVETAEREILALTLSGAILQLQAAP